MALLFSKKDENNLDYDAGRICLSCQASFSGRYCGRCGERVIESEDKSLHHFFNSVFKEFTLIDGKFLHSLRRLVLNPGMMSGDIVRGIRRRYMKPVAFFFVANFIYFLFPIFQTFNTGAYTQRQHMVYSGISSTMIAEHLKQNKQTFEEFVVEYDQASTNWSKLMLILLVVLMFPFLVLINYSKQLYLSDHMMFSLEYCTFLLFVPTILYGLFLQAVIVIAETMGTKLNFLFWDTYTTPFVLAFLLYFFIRGVRAFYGFKWWRVVLSSLLLIFAMQLVLSVYRFILFVVTIRSL